MAAAPRFGQLAWTDARAAAAKGVADAGGPPQRCKGRGEFEASHEAPR